MSNIQIIRGRIAADHIYIYVAISPYQSVSTISQRKKRRISSVAAANVTDHKITL